MVRLWQPSGQGARGDKRKANNFTEGLDTSVSPFYASENAYQDGSYGWDFDEYPDLVTRQGWTINGNVTLADRIGMIAMSSQVGVERAVRTVNVFFETSTAPYTTWSGSTLLALALGVDYDWTIFETNPGAGLKSQSIFITNQGFSSTTGPVYYENGILKNVDSVNHTMPSRNYITSDATRMYTGGGLNITGNANSVDDGDYIYYSAFQKPLDWTTPNNSGFVQYYTPNGGTLTGLQAFENQIWCFKQDSYGVLYNTSSVTSTGAPNFRLENKSYNIGCISFKTIQQINNHMMWLDQNDVYVAQGGIVNSIGQPIKSYLHRMNLNATREMFAWVMDYRYYLGLPIDGATQVNCELVYDLRYRKWHVRYINQNTGMRVSNIYKSQAYVGDNNGQLFVMQNGATTDNGVTINWRVVSRPFDDGEMEALKEPYEMHIQGLIDTGTTLTVETTPEAERDDAWLVMDTQDPALTDNVTQSRNMIIPLDQLPLCNFYRYRLTGSNKIKIHQVQRYSRLEEVMH